jgi:hypothetical protein
MRGRTYALSLHHTPGQSLTPIHKQFEIELKQSLIGILLELDTKLVSHKHIC